MAAVISFLAGINTIADLAGSGLGFYGSSGFGASVAVGGWQGRTFITDATGTLQGAEANNAQFLNTQSGILGQTGSGLLLTKIPNFQSTLNFRFNFDSAVNTQNVQLYIYDRFSINNPASGVTTAVAEFCHPDVVQNNNGSGSTTWQFPGGSGSIMKLTPSPGVSGLYAQGSGAPGGKVDSQHDWYLGLSASPNSVGSKTQYGLYVQLEYL
jgi:hypothetical protein